MKYSPMMGPTRWGKLIDEDTVHPGETVKSCVGLKPIVDVRYRGADRFQVHLSSRLVDRWVVQAQVSELPRGTGMEVFLRRIRDFDVPRNGQYAWQCDYDGLRPVQVPFDQFFGEPGAVDRLQRLLARSKTVAYVRVEPEGVRIRIHPHSHSWRIQDVGGSYQPTVDVHQLLAQSLDRNQARCSFPEFNPGNSRQAEYYESLIEDRKESPMLIPAGTKIVNCEFAGTPGKTYAYYTDLDLAAGDDVVVVSPYDGGYNQRGNHYREDLGGHLVVVRVVSLEETLEAVERVAKWVVQKVDASAYAKRLDAEKRVALLRAKIAKAEKAAREALELEKLRSLSPELAGLLDELQAVTGAAPKAAAE